MPISTPLDLNLTSSYPYSPSTLEDIDYAMYNYVQDELNIYVDSNSGFHKVPVIYSIPERSYQIKDSELLRPNGRTLQYPLLSILRQSVVKNPQNKGKYGVYIPPYYEKYYNNGGSIEIQRLLQQDKTKNFANANTLKKAANPGDKNYQTFPNVNKNIVYETVSIPMPTFVEVTYTITAISEYQQQMNDMMASFLTPTSTPSVFKVSHDNKFYEAFIQPDFTLDNNSSGLETSERMFKTNINIMVLGYLVGASKNQETPFVVRSEGAAKLKIQRERAILQESPEFNVDRKDKYRP
jgi:hypothetical protein